MSLKIGLIDADRLDNKTRHPNLALMKISNYCKQLNHHVQLLYKQNEIDNYNKFDIIIISKVFTFTKVPHIHPIDKLTDTIQLEQFNTCVYSLLKKFEDCTPDHTQIAIGGTGFFEDGGIDLHPTIEHIMPDYNLYSEFVDWMVNEKGLEMSYFDDYENYSIGFMTRGCFRKCPFCVNKKYDRCKFHAHVNEFLDLDRPKIYLWDDNVLACAAWRSIFDELDATNKPYQFRQGLDIRLITDEKAKRIARSHYYGDTIFAFDNVDDYSLINAKLGIWRKYSKRTTKLYVLCGFDSWLDPNRILKQQQKHLLKMYSITNQNERDQLDIEGVFIRIELLMRYGCLPYIMRHQNYLNSKYKEIYIQLARWCNQPRFFKKKSFAEFCKANQDYAKTDNICAPYQAFLDFKSERPDLADRYFNLKYEEVNAIKSIASFGRDETIPCIYCNNHGKWDTSLCSTTNLIVRYYNGELNQLCLICRPVRPLDNQCTVDETTMGKKLCKAILESSFDVILEGIDEAPDREITSELVPQLNQFNLAFSEVIDLFGSSEIFHSFEEIGSKCEKSKANTKDSNSKYGECQTKLLMMMDLVWKDRNGFKLTPLGKCFLDLSIPDRKIVFDKLILKIPMTQYLIKKAKNQTIDIEKIFSAYVGSKTASRRANQFKKLLDRIRECNSDLDERLQRLL